MHDIQDAGMFTHDSPENVFFIFNEIARCGNGIGMSAATNTWAIGNIIYDLTTPSTFTGNNAWGRGAAIVLGDSSGGAVNNLVYNAYYGIAVRSGSNWIANNNVITHMADANAPQIICDNSNVAAAMVFDYNLLDNSGNIRWGDSNMLTLAQLQSTHSKGLTTIVGNPAYADAPFDFTPLGSSDVIDAGEMDVSAYDAYSTAIGVDIAVDRNNTPRPASVSSWDIGPHEDE
jgi:hypothetical protein